MLVVANFDVVSLSLHFLKVETGCGIIAHIENRIHFQCSVMKNLLGKVRLMGKSFVPECRDYSSEHK